MKKILSLLVIIVFATQVGEAQKIKFKNKIVYADGNEFLHSNTTLWEITSAPILYYKNNPDTVVLTVTYNQYPCITTKFTSKGTPYEAEGNCSQAKIWFVEQDLEMYSSSDIKGIMKLLYNGNIIAANGQIEKEKLEKFIKLNSQEKKY